MFSFLRLNFFLDNFFFFLAALGLRCCADFSLVAANRGYSPVAVHRLLITVVSLVAEHEL